jgi:hypothetical protein
MGNLISQRLSKGKIYQHAYVYAQVKNGIYQIFQKELVDFQEEFQECQVFVGLSKKQVDIQLQTANLTFAAWLKTEKEQLLKLLDQRLPDLYQKYVFQLRVVVEK